MYVCASKQVPKDLCNSNNGTVGVWLCEEGQVDVVRDGVQRGGGGGGGGVA